MTVVITGANRWTELALFDACKACGQAVIGTARTGAPTADRLRLVCNAGVYLDRGERLETGYLAALWADSFAVNVTGFS